MRSIDVRNVVLSVVATALVAAPAAEAALMFTTSSEAARNNFGGMVGFQFKTGADAVTVRSLGFVDAGDAGLLASHRVGIFASQTNTFESAPSSSGGPLVTATVSTASSDEISGFRWADLETPLVLSANTFYWLGAEVFNGGDAWFNTGAWTGSFDSSLVDTTHASPFLFESATTNAWPGYIKQFTSRTNAPFNAANFSTTAMVPEPASIALIGLTGAFALRRRRSAR